MNDRLQELSDLGVSIWLDDLDRSRLTSGGLATMIEDDHVVGVTTNPTIFGKAISTGADSYAAQVSELAARGADSEQALNAMTTQDVRDACDVLAAVAERTAGRDGRVSIEVDPRLARDADATIAQARALWSAVDRPNLLIKIPATAEGLPAITEAIASGISVNVTLIFSVERYVQVLDAWARGLEQRLAQDLPVTGIHSVASFFVSRVDTAVDAALEQTGGQTAADLRGKAGIANARLAWQAYRDFRQTARWQALEAAGAAAQRPLWASTGVKDPAYPDDMYVVDLAGPGCVNTMPEATLRAVAEHGHLRGNTLDGEGPASQQVFDDLTALGVDLAVVFTRLEEDGVAKFTQAWEELLATVGAALAASEGPR
ncbi:MAG TPA: transaldolase [Actinomycetota bacterium]|nr:transaldolase [Actinomycetota bacterium]